MARGKSVHIVPRGNGWAVKTGGAPRAAKVTRTQQQAIRVGRGIAKRNGAELVTHNQQGRIRAKDSFGHDPCPPRG